MREAVWKKLYTGVFGVVGVAFLVLTLWLLFWLFGPLTHKQAPTSLEQVQASSAAAKPEPRQSSPPEAASESQPSQQEREPVSSDDTPETPSESAAETKTADDTDGKPEQSGPSEALLETRILYFEAYASEVKLDADLRDYLDKVKAYLDDSPDWHLAVIGHSDSSGPREFNIDVARERARTVARQLQKYDFSEDDLHVDSKGPDEPLVSNETEEGRAKNRLVELSLMPPENYAG